MYLCNYCHVRGACPDRIKHIRAWPLSEYLTITHRNLVKPSSKAGPLNNNQYIYMMCFAFKRWHQLLRLQT